MSRLIWFDNETIVIENTNSGTAIFHAGVQRKYDGGGRGSGPSPTMTPPEKSQSYTWYIGRL